LSTSTLKSRSQRSAFGRAMWKTTKYLGRGWRQALAVLAAFVLLAFLLQRIFSRAAGRQPEGSALRKVFVRFRRAVPALVLCTGLSIVLTAFWVSMSPELRDRWRGMYGPVRHAISFLNCSLFFFAVLWPLDTFVFDFYFVEKKSIQIPRLLRDVIRWPIYVFALAYAYSAAFEVPVAPLFATSAVLSFILGLALQDTLSNLFAGLAIHFEGSFAIGDLVRVGDQEGEVAAMTWRAIKIRTWEDNYMIIPNTTIAKGEIINYSQPTPVCARTLEIGVSYDVPPGRVEAVILETISKEKGVLTHPAPLVRLKAYGDSAITYLIRFWARDYTSAALAGHKVYCGIWYHFKRAGIEIPFPIRTIYMREPQRPNSAEAVQRKVEKLDGVDFLQPLSPAEREELARDMQEAIYAADEIILPADVDNDKFFLIESGTVAVERSLPGHATARLAEMRAPDFFGEYSLLTGEKTTATVRATEDVMVSVLRKEDFERILKSHPAVAEKISQALAERTEHRHKALDAVTADKAPEVAPAPGHTAEHAAHRIRDRIRRFFRLT
jgi:small-conductance mechanosensitive channel/CRP-like cAMP-binding protein